MTGRVKKIGASSVLVLVLLGGFFLVKYLTGAKDGEHCDRTRDCRRLWGGACVLRDGGYCSKTCDGDTDCWAGWSCRLMMVEHKKRDRQKKVCVPGN